MISIDRSAWICDMAETYGIYDTGSLPLRTVATLSAGLRDNSRIKMKISGAKASREELLIATVADGVHALLWRFGAYKDKPVFIVEALTKAERPKSNIKGFATGADLDKALAKFS